MNSRLDQLQPYPFQKLRELFADVARPVGLTAINLSIGEPKHPTPQFIKDALVAGLDGLANYPATQGSDALRAAIGAWAGRRYGVELDPATEVLPVNGSREALFAFAQAVIDPVRHKKRVVSPNPFYQIYEGAALLAGATPYYLNAVAANGFRMDWASIPEDLWEMVQLVYVCSPGNPTGKIMGQKDWQTIFDLADRHGFVIASDECYSEIYFEEGKSPLGALTAARCVGRGHKNLVVFNSLSKRSNVPGMRSGFAAGDGEIIQKFLLYRTYHGSAMSPAVQAASTAAWNDEVHVVENRRLYRDKFAAVTSILGQAYPVEMPEAAFYYWLKIPGSDTEFARELFRQQHVTVLPGSFLAREVKGINPGAGYVRIALVAGQSECEEAAQRMVAFAGKQADRLTVQASEQQ